MYPVSLGYPEVVKRLDALTKNEHHAEALLASVFAMEKTMRRSLRFCALNRGFISKQCDALLKNKGFHDLVALWPVFEREHRTLPDFLGNQVWQHIPEAVRMRNKMVHGARVFDLDVCRNKVLAVRAGIDGLRSRSIAELGCDPWIALPGKRKSDLNWLELRQNRAHVIA